MKAVDEIVQSIFEIDKHTKLFLRNKLKPYELNLADGLILMCYYGRNKYCSIGCDMNDSRENTKTQDQIVGQLHFDKSVTARAMQNLEQNGYLIRTDNPEDKRSYLFTLTEKGHAFELTLNNIIKDCYELLIQGIDQATLEIIKTGLHTISENATLSSKS